MCVWFKLHRAERRLLLNGTYNSGIMSILSGTNNIHLFVHDLYTTISNISSRFSINSEAFASELVKNLKEMFPRNNMHNYMFIMFKSYLSTWSNLKGWLTSYILRGRLQNVSVKYINTRFIPSTKRARLDY